MIKCFAYFKSNILDIPSSCFHSPQKKMWQPWGKLPKAPGLSYIRNYWLNARIVSTGSWLQTKYRTSSTCFFLMLIISFEKKRVNKAIKAHHKVWKYSFVSQSRYRNWIAWLQMSIVLINDNRQVSLGLNAWYFTMKHK